MARKRKYLKLAHQPTGEARLIDPTDEAYPLTGMFILGALMEKPKDTWTVEIFELTKKECEEGPEYGL